MSIIIYIINTFCAQNKCNGNELYSNPNLTIQTLSKQHPYSPSFKIMSAKCMTDFD